MKKYRNYIGLTAIILILTLGLFVAGVNGQLEGITNFNGLHLSQSTFGTATPQLLIANSGSNRSIEVRDSNSTPVFSVNTDGGFTGAAGYTNNQNLVVAAPTAIGTATPAVLIDNAGVSNLFEVRDAATPQLTIVDGGAATFTDNVALSGVMNWNDTDSVLTGAQTFTPTYTYLQVSPTAVLTITLATGSAADGDLLIVHNLVATQTDIVDTGATQGGGGINLGQDDIAIFIFGDGVWVEIASPDNS